MMNTNLNNSDFQCLQDQLVDLKTKNYELAEKNRRGRADFEAAKAKICSLQLKLEEQERDFQVTSATLRREIELAQSSNTEEKVPDEDYKAKCKKYQQEIEVLQQKCTEFSGIVQQLDLQNKELTEVTKKLESGNSTLRQELAVRRRQFDTISDEYKNKLKSAIEEYKNTTQDKCQEHIKALEEITLERNNLSDRAEELTRLNSSLQTQLESQTEETKIQERKRLKLVKELRRQLALEKSRTETLQKRLENLLSQTPVPELSPDVESRSRASASSSTNGNSSSNGTGSRVNNDRNSVSSWSLVPGATVSSEVGLNETLSVCSIDSEDRETVQHICDTRSESSLIPIGSSNSPKQTTTFSSSCNSSPSKSHHSEGSQRNLSYNEQKALLDRISDLQQEKWKLEERLSYMEQANSTLSEDVVNKSNIIRQYFMEQATKSTTSTSNTSSRLNFNNNMRRTSFPNNVQQLFSDKPNLKKVVDFLKDHSHIPTGGVKDPFTSETVSREATKRMQIMLEETLMKCLKLQENLDHVTAELNKTQS